MLDKQSEKFAIYVKTIQRSFSYFFLNRNQLSFIFFSFRHPKCIFQAFLKFIAEAAAPRRIMNFLIRLNFVLYFFYITIHVNQSRWKTKKKFCLLQPATSIHTHSPIHIENNCLEHTCCSYLPNLWNTAFPLTSYSKIIEVKKKKRTNEVTNVRSG